MPNNEGASTSHQVRVDHTICMGTGVCYGIAPDLFEARPDGLAVPRSVRFTAERGVRLADLVDACPTGAISLDGIEPTGGED
jgi:ferredoxin